MTTINDLRDALPRLDAKSQEFAKSLIAGYERYGSLTAKQQPFVAKLVERANTPAKPAGLQIAVGDMTGILALFDRAKTHLKFPAIELGVPGNDPRDVANIARAIRLNVAGEQAKVPGSVTVLTAERDLQTNKRRWLGRILRDGTFQAAWELGVGEYRDAVVARLSAFAADPSKVGGEDGRLHGRCCFCRIPLKDERSTAVGYGKICAGHFGLAWGARPAEFAGAATDGTEDYNNLARREGVR